MLRRNVVIGRDGSITGGSIIIGQTNNTGSSSIDDKLAEQFRYLRREFMESATNSGVAIPLDMVEDKNGHLYTFVKTNCPKYIFQIMQNNIKSVQLLRCSLSLIIITVTLLRRKCMDSSKSKQQQVKHSYGLNSSATSQNAISAWAIESLAKIVDSGTVSICIQVLIKSSNPAVQELALNLLAFLLPSSPNAIEQMLQPPSSTKEGSQQMAEKPFDIDSDKKVQSSAQRAVDHLKYMGSNKGNEMKFKKNSKKNSDKTLDSSCLSYVLSIAVLQKNRHLLLAGCADVIIAMLTLNPIELSEPIASSPTCHLPALDAQNTTTTSQKNTKKDYSLQQQPPTVQPINPLANRIIEWAGLKVLLKFLFSYQKITNRSKSDTLMRDSVSAALRLKEEYLYTHQRVLTAVCSLIAGSPAVASYANTLPGAEELLRVSALVHSPLPSQMENIVSTALFALKLERKLRQQQKHSAEAAANGSPKSRKLSTSFSMPNMQGGGIANNNSLVGGRSLDPSFSYNGVTRERRTETIQLMPQISTNFTSEYDINNDKNRLFVENNQANMMRARNEEPIRYMPNSDSLISNSLNNIDRHTRKPIVATPTILQDYQQYSTRNIAEEDDEDLESGRRSGSQSAKIPQDIQFQSSSTTSLPQPSLTQGSSQMQGAPFPSVAGNYKGTRSDKQLPSVHRDFFEQLPNVPSIPDRIEPTSVIDHNEDMSEIREKFAALAAEAIRKITSKGYIRNGKNSVPITERARRIYGSKEPPVPERLSDNDLKSDNMLEDEEYNPYLHQEEQRSLTSEPSEVSSPTPMFGLRLDNIEFEEQNLFDNFKPLFDLAAPAPTSSYQPNESEDDLPQHPGDDNKQRSKYGRSVKLATNFEQSVDLLL